MYDNLHRLDYSTLDTGSGPATNLELSYDLMGNIMSKSDVGTGTWTYHATKKHAVTAVPGFTFDYDDNGNQVERDNGTSIDQITWTSYNHPSEIENGSKTHAFYYDGYRNRWKQVYDNGTASETTIFVGNLLEKRSEGSYTEYRHYIRTDSRAVALVTQPSTGTVATRYLLRDHQGGVAEIVDGIAADDVSLSYRAFGERRDPDDWDSAFTDAALVADATDRGYTGHTNLESHTLIHMNGRVMDGLTGRFLSPDPFIPRPGMTQSYNRYSYVRNRPLSLVDPSGFADCVPVFLSGSNVRILPRNWCLGLNDVFRNEIKKTRDFEGRDVRISQSSDVPASVTAQWGLANNVPTDMPNSDIAAAPMLQGGQIGSPNPQHWAGGLPCPPRGRQCWFNRQSAESQRQARQAFGAAASGTVLAFVPGPEDILLASYVARILKGTPESAIEDVATFGAKSVGAAQRVPRVLQSGGQTINQATADALNDFAGTSLARREVGRALEALKREMGLPNRLPGSQILDNGEFVDEAGTVLGNIIDYFP